jgi:AsmA protein
MKRRYVALLSAGGVLVALGLAVVLMPLDAFRAPIEGAASSALKRAVHIRGPLHLTLFPKFGVSLADVSVANAEGARDPQMLSVESIVVGARLMPLLSRRLEVTDIVLKKPVIHLEVGGDGGANWQFSKDETAARSGENAAANLGIDKASIEDGSITYYDARSGRAAALSAVSLNLTMPARNPRPLIVAGTLTYNGEAVKLTASLTDFDSFMKGAPSNTHVGIASNVINADFTGRIDGPGALSGTLKAGARSLRRVAAWTGHPMPAGNGFGLVAVESQIVAKDRVYSLTKASVGFDGMRLNGDVALDMNGEVPAVQGKLALDHLDVKPYLAPGASEDTYKAAKNADADAPLALGGLKAVNADLTLTIGPLTLPNLKLDHAVLVVALRDGVLKTDMNNLAAYGGTGKGALTLDASGAVPSMRNTLDIAGINVQPFLTEMVGVKRIAGTGTVRYDVSAQGTTSTAMVKGLNGKGEVRFTKGTVTGVDLSAVARVLQSVLTAQVLTGAVGDQAKTEFGELGGSFTIQNGVLRTNDMKLTNPVVEMSGKGTVDLAEKQMDLHFVPRAKAGIAGLKMVDVGIPFYVKGPFAKPSYGPDAGNIAKGIVEAVGNGTLKTDELLKNPGNALRSLFGGGR